ncbi:putative reverse transcriptase domain-containing protein [Tanacetum coccineum]
MDRMSTPNQFWNGSDGYTYPLLEWIGWVTANGGNGGNGGNGRNKGCSYKGFKACNPKEYDGKGDWFHKLAKLVPHLVTPESSRIKRAGILTNEAVNYGTLTKGNEIRKGASPRNKFVGSYPKCAKCYAYHPENGACKLCFNCQKPSYFAKDCRAPYRQVALVNAVRMGNGQTVCYECGSSNHLCNTCPKMNQAPDQARNPVALEGNPDFSFISTEFAPLLNVKPSIVNPGYVIEVADSKKVEFDRIIRDWKLELGNSLFSINLIPLGHGSFDVIVGMDWLSSE